MPRKLIPLVAAVRRRRRTVVVASLPVALAGVVLAVAGGTTAEQEFDLPGLFVEPLPLKSEEFDRRVDVLARERGPFVMTKEPTVIGSPPRLPRPVAACMLSDADLPPFLSVCA